MDSPLIWLDMEMTGLSTETCVPIEVAIIVTDGDLNPLGEWESVIWQPPSRLESMSPFVRKMHTDNGLLAKVSQATKDTADVERQMVDFLLSHSKPGKGVLAGNSVHHDKRFLEKYFPTFHSLLHYRIVDVSSIKELSSRWFGDEVKYKKPLSDHTALADIRSSIAELQYYRTNLFK